MRKKKARSKISTTEIRTPINLQQLANNQRALLGNRQDTPNLIPFIKARGFSPADVKPYRDNDLKPSASSKMFYPGGFTKSEHMSQAKIKAPLNIEVNNSLETHPNFLEEKNSYEDSEMKDYDNYQAELQKIKQEHEENIWGHAEDINQSISKKYKAKYKAKLQEVINRQNEIHKFQIDSLKKNYEAKILKYKDIIEKLHHENEELSHGKAKTKHSDLINPLIEENIWLKQQLNSLKSTKKN